MKFKQRCLISYFVWFWTLLVSEMVVAVNGAVVIASYGKEFFLPYLVLCNNDAYLHIVPTTLYSTNVLLTIKLLDNRTIYTNTINQSETLNVNYSALMDLNGGHYKGWQIISSQAVSVYLKRSKGDITILLPIDALGTDYLLPSVATVSNDKFRVIVYAVQNNTTINVSGNSFDRNTENETQGNNGEKTTHALNRFQSLILETNNMTKCTLSANGTIGALTLRFNELEGGAVCDVLDLKTIETIPLSSSFGKHFYYRKFDQQANLTLYITGEEDGEVLVKTDQTTFQVNLTLNETVSLEFPTAKYVTLMASIPIQVYATTVIVITETQEYILNDFFIPCQEQYVRCTMTSSCTELCPLVLNGASPFNSTDPNSFEQFSFSDATLSPWFNVSSEIISHYLYNNGIIMKIWTNSSFIYFMCEINTGRVFPLGMRLSKLYRACVPDIVSKGGQGDGIDNDCDGQIDEENINMEDDDGDSRIDEDTNFICTLDDITLVKTLPTVAKKKRAPTLLDIAIDEQDSTMPLIAVVLSLTVAIFAVFAVISIFMFLELLSRRKQIRNTKIRPFVS
ncbi:uncharacterized protein LOC126824374 [Patella vulgata]|uniref:uncharacterized protein LOC126824374 n=1 Tax=Patella vulgata TaxID=6465 RepID=UPI00218035B4|nr:uncharacterized protein LOC126824374 [Patella vulgata]XP_050409548.1 uncharacterized protein LOC126824374 [Patella vulgata]XP_050409550.1 uncharacterized protein LOC126824374 [Patella vulgata]